MQVNDRLYKNVEIKSHLIQSLIATKPFQRLKHINQYGGVNYVYPNQYQVTRFEHSIGVWHVLSQLGVDMETQVAGLLHDIGHTAFSHMVDQAMENPNEDYHEQFFDLIEGMAEINAILNSANITLKPLEHYPAIKKSLPAIGADRLDYAMRDFVGATGERSELAQQVIDDITLFNGCICFRTPKVAREFAETGLDAMWAVIYDPKVAVVYQAATEILRNGLQEKWISGQDLVQTDAYLLDKFFKNAPRLNPLHLRVFKEPFEVKSVGPNEAFDFKHVKLKIRYFDPPVIVEGRDFPLSKIDSAFADLLADKVRQFELRKGGEYLKITWGH